MRTAEELQREHEANVAACEARRAEREKERAERNAKREAERAERAAEREKREAERAAEREKRASHNEQIE